jgi:hypothetical protein
MDCFKEGVRHIPLQLAGIRQFIEGYTFPFLYKKGLAKGKTVIILSILNFAFK